MTTSFILHYLVIIAGKIEYLDHIDSIFEAIKFSKFFLCDEIYGFFIIDEDVKHCLIQDEWTEINSLYAYLPLYILPFRRLSYNVFIFILFAKLPVVILGMVRMFQRMVTLPNKSELIQIAKLGATVWVG